MSIIDAIKTRRSIRQFTDQKVDETVLQHILAAAMHAPSAIDEQPWQFIVLDDRALMDAIPQFHPHAAMIAQAPVGVLICGDKRLFKLKDYWVQDCSAATQNMLLAAHALGLGAVWTGIYPSEERVQAFVNLLGLPDFLIPFALVPIGYPNETPPAKDPFKETRIHRNRVSPSSQP